MKSMEVLRITDKDILYERMNNGETTAIAEGDVVSLDLSDSNGRTVKRASIANDTKVIGIAAQSGNVIFRGAALANIQTDVNAVAVGDLLTTSTNAGKLIKATTPVVGGVIAIALEAVTANTTKSLAKVYVIKC